MAFKCSTVFKVFFGQVKTKIARQ